MPPSTSRRLSRSYSSAEPSHQWMLSGWVSAAICSTHARSFAFAVGAFVDVAVVSLKGAINSSLVSPPTFTDTTVLNGTAYFYVVTAVSALSSSNVDIESVFSNEASAVIP